MKGTKYFCEWQDKDVSVVTARNCNYLNDENYSCRHDNQPCVAKVGLELFAQHLAQSSPKGKDSDSFLELSIENDPSSGNLRPYVRPVKSAQTTEECPEIGEEVSSSRVQGAISAVKNESLLVRAATEKYPNLYKTR